MHHRTTRTTPLAPRRVAVVAVCALILGAGAAILDAGSADAAVISAQTQRDAGERIPRNVDFPASRLGPGDRIPRGFAIVGRRIRMDKGEAPRNTSLTCPGRLGTRSLSASDPGEIAFSVRDASQYRKRVTRFRFQVAPFPSQLVKGDAATGTVWLLCGPKRGPRV